MNLLKRAKAPTPKFFKVLRNFGLALGAIGGTIVAEPIGLPFMVSSIGRYLVVAGSVLSVLCQLTTQNEDLNAVL